ncbi:MAG: dihydroorotase family protein [Candidatus Peribacteraceae bacterium]|nr:dihydroorotase family protein [Candidatus Peribacteraceae bacterium]
MTSLLIRGGSIVRLTGDERADLLITDGVIRAVFGRAAAPAALPAADSVIDASNQLIFPGFIDAHVHFREPGYEQKGTMESEAQSAVAGGVTTVCDMPNTIPPTVTVAALREKVRRAESVAVCDIRFFFGVTQAAHLKEVARLWGDSSEEGQRLKGRCAGVKLFFDHSTGNQKAEAGVLAEAFRLCAELSIPVIAHCEDPRLNARAAKLVKGDEAAAHSRRRPPDAEEHAVTQAIELCAQYGTHLHITHLSTAGGLERVRKAKEQGLAVTCDVTPHHLFLTTDDYKGLGTLAKMNPPLRPPGHSPALWAGIEDGTVDCVVSDHAPHTYEEKASVPPPDAPSGVPGVETMLPLLFTVAAGHCPHPQQCVPIKSFRYADILRLCFTRPNEIFSLGKKGITAGDPADLVLVRPDESWELSGSTLHAKCGWTPYEGWKVTGRATVVGKW